MEDAVKIKSAFLFLLFPIAVCADANYKKVTICASGCDYTLTALQLQWAIQDAVDYQAASCVPYFIEGPAGVSLASTAGYTLPAKTCEQYVEIRSSGASRFSPGRYVPATDDPKAFNLVGSGAGGAMFITAAAGTRYWRFRNIRFSTTPGAGQSAFIQWGQTFTPDFSLNALSHHLEVIQCGMEGLGQSDVYSGVTVAGNNVSIRDSYIANMTKSGSDSQAITVVFGSVIEVRNNYLSALDETVFLGGGMVMPSGILPMFEYVIGNKITKEPWMNHTHGRVAPTKPCWQGNWYTDDSGPTDYLCSAVSGVWNVQSTPLPYVHRYMKNSLETKLGLGLRILGNSFGPMGAQASQDPYFVALDMTTQPGSTNNCGLGPQPCDRPQPWTTIGDALIEGNSMHDGFSSMALGSAAVNAPDGYQYHFCASDPTQPCYVNSHNNIKFRNNLISNIADERNYCMDALTDGYCNVSVNAYGATGPMTMTGGQFDIDISHNTHSVSTTTSHSGQYYLLGYLGLSKAKNINISNNIMNNEGIGTQPPNGASNGCAMEMFMDPAFYGTLFDEKNILTNESADRTPADFATAAIGPTCLTDGSYWKWPLSYALVPSAASILDANFRVTSASGYQGWGSDGRDPGADIDLVNWRTAHAEDGASYPALDYAIRNVLPTASGSNRGLKIYFTAPSANACTWELSLDPNGYGRSVPASSQSRNGRDGLAVWNNGTLAVGAAYWARVTCDGMQLETGLNGDRAHGMTAP
jgi:hypothetical protein